MDTIIHDKHGRQYQVSQNDLSKDFTRFDIRFQGRRVGYANCHFIGGDVLHLDDLHIQDKVIRPPWFSVDLFFWTASFPLERCRITNYRKQGIGTALIKFLTSYARSKSAKRIEGEVKHHDFKDNPDLPSWYRRRGFNVEMGNNKSRCVATISLDIAVD